MKITRRSMFRLAGVGCLSRLVSPSRAAVGTATTATDFRPLFDGSTLTGWHAVPRLAVPKSIDPMQVASTELRDCVRDWYLRNAKTAADQARVAHVGHWTAEDGVLVGAQEPSGSGLGAYLMTNERQPARQLSR